MDKRGKVYLAGPFFNAEQLGAIERIESLLTDAGVEFYSPRKHLILKPQAPMKDRKKVFDENMTAISECNLILACTEWPDSGTVWEMGLAYGLHIPVVGFTQKADKINVMLAQGCSGFLTSEASLIKFLNGRYESIWFDYDWEETKQWLKNIF